MGLTVRRNDNLDRLFDQFAGNTKPSTEQEKKRKQFLNKDKTDKKGTKKA